MNDDNDPIVEALSEDNIKVPTPEDEDEQDFDGTMPNVEGVEGEDTLDRAHRSGLYENSDEEHPAPLNIAGEIETAEKRHLTED